MTNFERTTEWLKTCGKTPDAYNASVQAGCMLEEFVEMLRCMRVDDDFGDLIVRRTIEDLDWLATKIKRQEYFIGIPNHLREPALDAMCDVEVTLNGLAYLQGMNKAEADQRVLASNEDKLDNGQPVILQGGKIGKREGWKAPKLGDLV